MEEGATEPASGRGGQQNQLARVYNAGLNL